MQRFLWSLVITVHQKDLVKDVTVCLDVQMSEYKERYPDDSEDPPDVGLSSKDEAMGIEEVVGIAHRVILSRPSPAPPASKPSTSWPTKTATPPVDPSASELMGDPTKPPEGYVKLAKDEVIIKKAVLHGIKWGAELALKGQAPATFLWAQQLLGTYPLKFLIQPHIRCTVTFVGRTCQHQKLSDAT